MVLGRYCFDVDAFAADEFSVTAFLEECRARNPMETVHQDLRDFQTSLENQLVAIINEDYAEFLQLSSKLKGVDEAVSSVRAPILAILKRVDLVQQSLTQLQSTIHARLEAFSDLHRKERDLELSIRISERLLLIEELLEIASPLDDERNDATAALESDDRLNANDDDDDGFDNFDAVQRRVTTESSASETCARLERAAQNFVALELEFFAGADIPLIQREEKRLAVIEETLLRRLETEFATEIFPDTFYSREHTLNTTTLSFLLRAYAQLQRPDVPEDMVARLLVVPFADETVTRGKLDGGVRGSCDGLAGVYDAVLDFVATTFGALLALPVCQGGSGDRKSAVDLLGNAICKPLVTLLVTKHSVIFQAADPDRFHRSYTQSMAFVSQLETQWCATDAMRQRFRAHESVVEFADKWNLDVYFQLRATQLARTLEQSFGVKRLEATSDVGSTQLQFASSRALIDALQQCWADDVFLAPLVASFSKLCAQLLLFYIRVWQPPLADAVAQLTSGSKIDANTVALYAIDNGEDVVCAGSDFRILRDTIVSELLPLVATRVAPFVDSGDAFASDYFDEALASLEAMETSCWSAAAVVVADECKKVLPALRTVKGQYQMTNKPPPTVASAYVTSIVRPLSDFVAKWGVHFAAGSTHREQLCRAVLDDVCELYNSLSSELLKSAQELEESLKSRKLQRNASSSLAAATTGAGAAMSDTDKMRMQLRLDLDEMQRQVLALGFALECCGAFQRARASLDSVSCL